MENLMLPNDPRLALFQANATIEERHRQAAQERLAAQGRTTGHPGILGGGREPSRGFRGLADRLRAVLAGHIHPRPSTADDIS
jgi:hypothetical protein